MTPLLHCKAGAELGIGDEFLDVCGRFAETFECDAVDVAGKSIHVRVVTNGCAGIKADVESFSADGKDHGHRAFDTNMTDGFAVDAENRLSAAAESAVVSMVNLNGVSTGGERFV